MLSKQLRPLLTFSQGLISRDASKMMPKQMSSSQNYKTLNITVPKPFVFHVQLNRPDKLNAMNDTMWKEIHDCFTVLGDKDDCRVVLLSGNGKLFSAGLDFTSMISVSQQLSEHDDVARRCKILRNLITRYQDSITSLEKCVKPVISLVHNACIGGAVDLITAADIRYCTEDAVFQIKEVDIGMAADVGTLQRLPKVIGSTSLANELAFTGRKLFADEAKACGLVNRIYENKESMLSEALQIAEDISKKSPVGVQGTKRSIIFSRDHSVQESLNNIADWNQTMLQSEDFINAGAAEATKSPTPIFAKL